MLKRTIDISIALLAIVLFLPFFPFVWLLLRLNSKSSVFTTEDIVGRDKKLVRLYRFRLPSSSVEDSTNGKRRKRLFTRICRLFEELKLDGWPLLFNVLKGELSLVGPRPETQKFVKHYSEEENQVLSIRPGILGPYCDGKNGDSIEVADSEEHYQKHILPEKLKVELLYVRNTFLGRDIKVILTLFRQKLANTIDAQLMKEAKNRNFFLPLDVLLISCSYAVSYQLRFDWAVPANEYTIFFKTLPIILVFRVATFYYCGLYTNLWKYVGVRDLVSIINACTISSILTITATYLFWASTHSRSIFLIDWLLCIFLIGGSKLILRIFNESIRVAKKVRENVLIIGAGDVGEMLLRELDKNGHQDYQVVGFVDDDEAKHGRTIHGVKVLGACDEIPELVPMLRIDEVLITINQFSSDEMKAILSHCIEADVRHRIVPAVSDLLSGAIHLSKFRKVEISDLFGRQPVELDLSAIKHFLQGKRVLVTGAGGSIGSELCRQISEYHPQCIILVDKNENYLHEIRCELDSDVDSTKIFCSLSDITKKSNQRRIFERYKPEIVFHAAAQKHVPLSEENPEEAVLNNVNGTKVIADLANEYGVEAFVMVSTDKAVNPTSVMGATKRVAELYIQALAGESDTKFLTVRFGNVLNSNGSVVPVFMKQIERGGPITVTHPVVERYFMSISEAVQLILQAVTMGNNCEIFILNMGKSIRILDLAIELIKHSGLKPHKDIQIKLTGLRPGEKMREELIGRDEDVLPTSHTGIKTLKYKHVVNRADISEKLEELFKYCGRARSEKLILMLKQIVPEYHATSGTKAPLDSKEVFDELNRTELEPSYFD